MRLERKTAHSSIAWSEAKQKPADLHLWTERAHHKLQHLHGTNETNSSVAIHFSASQNFTFPLKLDIMKISYHFTGLCF